VFLANLISTFAIVFLDLESLSRKAASVVVLCSPPKKSTSWNFNVVILFKVLDICYFCEHPCIMPTGLAAQAPQSKLDQKDYLQSDFHDYKSTGKFFPSH
jgi:hypothetical protein